MLVFGTRPEAIKMAPVLHALRARGDLRVGVCVSAQHRQMLDQVLALFDIVPDDDLDLMRPGQDLTGVTCGVLSGMQRILAARRPRMVLVHGDTSTTFSAALAAFYAGIEVGHVEAGLRTGNMRAPWPEEMNRRLTAPLTTLHFAPTPRARANLIMEGMAEASIEVTGNTVIDALLQVRERLRTDAVLDAEMRERFGFLSPSRRMVLVTGHRRENFGDGFEHICMALRELSEREDVEIVYPVHLNPNVQEPVKRILGDRGRVHLIEPQDYLPFVWLMDRATLLITDSGGIQEEAPSLGKPVLVMRDVTERPEAVEAGTVRLVGTDTARIVAAATALLDDEAAYKSMSRGHNPYGDGHASERIAARVARHLGMHAIV
ncbi:UDP-N-acetylglucosamine 2-epimerase (non-hydrolyzing) [Lysobacter oculi]|uniref:UDP-N-acetylglucosamine 2-epimerase (non-hydrolyzing) n=2 Tax=Solilutibacter oculi TaxID=2698682 RepID=A0A344J8L9_9GAMM|nr:UDP-N-acetylglucosamine 2-epimerase (non-hydrolyzing) [Lysobacter oculi]